MMIMLEELNRVAADRLRCRIRRDGVASEFTVRCAVHEEGLRTLGFEDLSPKQSWTLRNSDEFRPLLKILYSYLDGALISLPRPIEPEGTAAGDRTPAADRVRAS